MAPNHSAKILNSIDINIWSITKITTTTITGIFKGTNKQKVASQTVYNGDKRVSLDLYA